MEEIKIIENELLITAELHKTMIKHASTIKKIVDIVVGCYKNGKKVILVGNGGSAADAQHVAAELVGRFKIKRKPLEAISLTTDTSNITAIGNDFGFEYIFSRQCEAIAKKGDVFIAFSTSGNSLNVLNAIKIAKKKGCKVLGFTGKSGGKLKQVSDIVIRVPSSETSKIQEIHRTVAHIICELVEQKIEK